MVSMWRPAHSMPGPPCSGNKLCKMHSGKIARRCRHALYLPCPSRIEEPLLIALSQICPDASGLSLLAPGPTLPGHAVIPHLGSKPTEPWRPLAPTLSHWLQQNAD